MKKKKLNTKQRQYLLSLLEDENVQASFKEKFISLAKSDKEEDRNLFLAIHTILDNIVMSHKVSVRYGVNREDFALLLKLIAKTGQQ